MLRHLLGRHLLADHQQVDPLEHHLLVGLQQVDLMLALLEEDLIHPLFLLLDHLQLQPQVHHLLVNQVHSHNQYLPTILQIF